VAKAKSGGANWCPRGDLVVEAHGGKGERGREEAAEEEDTKERARYAWVPAIAGTLLREVRS